MTSLIVETLRGNQLFSSLTAEEIEEIIPFFEQQPYEKDQSIFTEGDKSQWLYLAAHGRVKIVKHTPEGKDVILEIIDPGDIFGGVAVLDGRPYPATAQAMEDCRVVRIRRTDFFELLNRFHVLSLEASIYFGERLRNAYDMLRSVAVERVERRIATLLLKFGERIGRPEGEDLIVEMGLTMQDIAEMVGTTVETTIRTMNKFKRDGLIQYGKGVTVLKPALRERFSS